MIARAGPRIFVSAGEPSGDLHGAAVVRVLRERYPDASIEALGGPRMAQAGATLRYDMEGLAAFGFVEIVTKLAAHVRLLRALRQDLRAGRYALVILIDYPGFHLRVAEAARAAGTKVLYYIAPQLWAWRPERARRLAAAVDRLAVVLPFEQPFFSGLGLRMRCTRSGTGKRRRNEQPHDVQRQHHAHPFRCALTSSYLVSARTHTSLKSHIESKISRMVADVFARSALPKANMLLLRKYPMIRGSEIR